MHAVLESCLSSASAGLPVRLRPRMQRSASLRATLEAADIAGLPDIPRAIDAAIRLADQILLAAHRPAALDMTPERIAYIAEPNAVAADWASFRRDLDGLELPEPAAEAVLRAAEAKLDAARGISRAWEGTFPWSRDPARFSASWIAAIDGLAGELDRLL